MKRARTRAGIAGSVLVHLLFLCAAILSLPRKGPPPEPHDFQVSLVPWRLTPPPLPRPVRQAAAAPRPPSATSSAQRPATAPIPSPIIAPPTPAPAPAGDEDQGRAKLAAVLRGSFGCSEASFLRLSRQEQDRCEALRRAHAAPGLELPVFVAPEKRAGFEASLAARHAPSHPPGFVCGMLIDGLRLKIPKAPPHSLKLGPAPCYVVPPKFALTEEADVEMPSKQASEGDALYFNPHQLLMKGKMAPGMGQPQIDLGNNPGE